MILNSSEELTSRKFSPRGRMSNLVVVASSQRRNNLFYFPFSFGNPYSNLQFLFHLLLFFFQYGTWGWCSRAVDQDDFSYCNKVSHGWQARLNLTGNNADAAYDTTLIKSSWTRG